MPEPLHLVKIPLLAAAFVKIAARRGYPLRELDDGYLAHCLLAELWQKNAPAPFHLKGAPLREDGARGRGVVDVWGYTAVSADHLANHARDFGDPTLLEAIDGGPTAISGKEMPRFEAGRRVGFLLRACPVVRTKSPRDPGRSREVDAFIAAWAKREGEPVERERVYVEWLRDRLKDKGVSVERLALAGFSRERLVRRTQGEQRAAKTLERPDARFEGDLRVDDADAFAALLRRGVGRHRAFGFGMMVLVPPGHGWS